MYRDPGDIAHVAVISGARERTELLADVSQFDTSNRVVYASPGDAFVLHNTDGFWALVYIDKLYTRAGHLNREELVDFRYAIQPNRNPRFQWVRRPGNGRLNAPRRAAAVAAPTAGTLLGHWDTGRARRTLPWKRRTRSDAGRSGFRNVGLTGFEPATT